MEMSLLNDRVLKVVDGGAGDYSVQVIDRNGDLECEYLVLTDCNEHLS